MGVIMRAEMHDEPTPPLKQASREEDGAKNFKKQIIYTPYFRRRNHVREPKININEEPELEGETTVVKKVEEIALK
ncbi:hypothetical protein CWI38_0662p0040 [Hamiltosporidium tvaerminnensis]|uniref:Uncharacterized protein n=1 Tax=Hamiltosporidium tvaerminnensis TaxID=1176355 RepID=A0A4Q9LWM0_9MICR|nr:hypothetical protein CWI38_1908p0010 [Hamiltosporidium tvaerminnensis]TBU11653.1 hypothetical protein CWI38_1099p0030 [Hamiltosporidium tvaerminnensis]TBU12706.1 hypothetical protein CWI38_0662p0040 [Hamiltosporidium tvaerminnensis]